MKASTTGDVVLKTTERCPIVKVSFKNKYTLRIQEKPIKVVFLQCYALFCFHSHIIEFKYSYLLIDTDFDIFASIFLF